MENQDIVVRLSSNLLMFGKNIVAYVPGFLNINAAYHIAVQLITDRGERLVIDSFNKLVPANRNHLFQCRPNRDLTTDELLFASAQIETLKILFQVPPRYISEELRSRLLACILKETKEDAEVLLDEIKQEREVINIDSDEETESKRNVAGVSNVDEGIMVRFFTSMTDLQKIKNPSPKRQKIERSPSIGEPGPNSALNRERQNINSTQRQYQESSSSDFSPPQADSSRKRTLNRISSSSQTSHSSRRSQSLRRSESSEYIEREVLNLRSRSVPRPDNEAVPIINSQYRTGSLATGSTTVDVTPLDTKKKLLLQNFVQVRKTGHKNLSYVCNFCPAFNTQSSNGALHHLIAVHHIGVGILCECGFFIPPNYWNAHIDFCCDRVRTFTLDTLFQNLKKRGILNMNYKYQHQKFKLVELTGAAVYGNYIPNYLNRHIAHFTYNSDLIYRNQRIVEEAESWLFSEQM